MVLVIFEARPEALPQIAALALRAGCAVVMKGGSEARLSNAVLHATIKDAIAEFGNADLDGAVSLLEGRAQVAQLLKAGAMRRRRPPWLLWCLAGPMLW